MLEVRTQDRNFNRIFEKGIGATGRERLIRTWLIRSSTLFEVSVKCFPIIFLSFHVQNALLIRSSI